MAMYVVYLPRAVETFPPLTDYAAFLTALFSRNSEIVKTDAAVKCRQNNSLCFPLKMVRGFLRQIEFSFYDDFFMVD